MSTDADDALAIRLRAVALERPCGRCTGSARSAVRGWFTQFQALTDGHDVRVHGTSGEEARLHSIDAPPDVEQPALTCPSPSDFRRMLDVMVDRRGDVNCLEVDPSTAFSYYEQHTGQPIAREIARCLAAGPD